MVDDRTSWRPRIKKLMSWLWFLESGVSLEAATLSHGREVRRAYILPSPDPIHSFAIGEIILGMVVYFSC
ncbi:hypothetical protein Hanom_Chr01g00062781 [Helianthus anomalus]